jgi:phosphatidylglycerophosphate synthase
METSHMTAGATTLTRSAPRPYRDPTRVLTSVLAPLEKRVLLWLAARMPLRVNSDHLTALALVAMLAAGLSFWLASVSRLGLVLVVVCLAVNWFGDSLDGTLARVRRQERPRYGFYVDHVCDILGTAFLLGGLALSSYMTPLIAIAVLAVYCMVLAETFLATHSVGTFTMSVFRIGPTELRILLAIGALTLAVHPDAELFGRTFKLFDVGGVCAMAGLGVVLLRSAIANGRALSRAEPRPSGERGSVAAGPQPGGPRA